MDQSLIDTSWFFIVGAPKAGTTSLWSWLRTHPDVVMPAKKEPHFFAEARFVKRAGVLSPGSELVDYLSLFHPMRSGQQVAGEASVYYLYSHGAAQRIAAFQPEARIVVLLRNPAEVVASLHQHYLYNLTENIRDLRQAWEAQDQRANLLRIPSTCRLPELLQYRYLVRFGEQLARYHHYFPTPAILVLWFDDLIRNPRFSYLRVLRFLGLDDDGRSSFSNANPAKRTRSRHAARWITGGGRLALYLQRTAKLPPSRIGRHLRAWNTLYSGTRHVPSDLVNDIMDELSGDLSLLRRLTRPPYPDWLARQIP